MVIQASILCSCHIAVISNTLALIQTKGGSILYEVRAILQAFCDVQVNLLLCFLILCHEWCHLNVHHYSVGTYRSQRGGGDTPQRKKGKREEGGAEERQEGKITRPLQHANRGSATPET